MNSQNNDFTNENLKPEGSPEEAVASSDTTPEEADSSQGNLRPDSYAVPPIKKKKRSEGTDGPKHASAMDDADDFIFARYHGKKSHSYSSSSEEAVVRSSSSPHSRHHKHRKHKENKWKTRPWWQKLLIILGWIFGSIVALCLIAAIAVVILNHVGLLQLTDYENLDMKAPEMDGMSLSISDNGRNINYKGQEYAFNEDMTSILCIGVDKNELGLEDNMVGTAGQADALYLIALDTENGKTSVIAVPRDIVTDIGIYSPDGEYLRTEKMQICLAYAYGDGRKTSCTNTVTAVSRLFYQLPINSYFAINLSAIADLNDAVGGVTVTMIDDSFYDTNLVHHYKGETLTLHGDDARKYLQQREVSELESSLDRLDRQMNYLKSFSSTALNMTKSDLTTPVNLYNIVSDNSETNLSPSKITAFATCVVSNGINELDFIQVPGNITSDGTYAQYVVDEEGLYELILDTYYTPVETN